MLAKNTLITSILLLFSVLLFLSCDESTDNTVEEILNCSLNNPSATIIRKIQRNEQTIQMDFIFKDYEEVTCGNGISQYYCSI